VAVCELAELVTLVVRRRLRRPAASGVALRSLVDEPMTFRCPRIHFTLASFHLGAAAMSVQRTAGALDESHVRRLGEKRPADSQLSIRGRYRALVGIQRSLRMAVAVGDAEQVEGPPLQRGGEVIMVNEGMSLPVPCHAATRDNNSDGASRTGAR
jgi:hypothetical protein